MRKYLLSLHGIWKSVLRFDALLLSAGLLYCILAPAPLELTPGSGFFLFLGLLSVAFCQAQLLRKNNSAFILAARLPFRYETFFLAFLALFTAPLLGSMALLSGLYGGLAQTGLLPLKGSGFAVRVFQTLFAFAMIKTFTIHLFAILQRGIPWLVAYVTLLLGVIFGIKFVWDFINFPDSLFALIYLSFQVYLIFYAIRKGFHRPL